MTPHARGAAEVTVDGARIRQLREEKGEREDRRLSRELMAVEAGVPYGTLMALEQGKYEDVKASTLHRVAAYLGVAMEDLLR